MYHLIYVSSAVNLFNEEDLKGVLEASRRNNGACGVTGLLLYLGGNFIQVLEGEKEDVLRTHGRIAGDTRHRGLMTLLQGEVEAREFEDWSMAFKKVEAGGDAALPGYSDFLRTGVDPSAQKSAALRLLENFKKINR